MFAQPKPHLDDVLLEYSDDAFGEDEDPAANIRLREFLLGRFIYCLQRNSCYGNKDSLRIIASQNVYFEILMTLVIVNQLYRQGLLSRINI